MTTNEAGKLDRDLYTAGAQPYKAVIPMAAPSGDAMICAREKYPNPGETMTTHSAVFTVVGGSA